MSEEEAITQPMPRLTFSPSVHDSDMSNEIGELAAALAQAQSELSNPKKDKSNPFFKSKYADLSSCLEVSKKALSKHKIAIVQTTNGSTVAEVKVCTMLIHASGQWLKSTITMKPNKPDAQGIGSVITYARRYGLSAVVGIAGDDDDDGNAASDAHKKYELQKPPTRVVAKRRN